MSSAYRRCLLLGLVAIAPLGCGSVRGDADAEPMTPPALSAEEVRHARALAERDLAIDPNPSIPAHRTYFIKVDLLPNSEASDTRRLAMVHHYRYQRDETVLTMVDLGRGEVTNRDVAAHFPTALAAPEASRAMALARADNRLASLLKTGGLSMETRPMQFNPNHPQFGHRAVLVLLHDQGNYLETPTVVVDLHTETVHFTN